MSHSYHEGQRGYSPDRILHDGCLECATRSASRDHGIGSLDPQNFARAWERAADWNRWGLTDVSEAEAPLLCALWAVQVQLERIGWPLGKVPQRMIEAWLVGDES